MEAPHPIIGATYTERSTGRDFELAGLRSGRKVLNPVIGRTGSAQSLSVWDEIISAVTSSGGLWLQIQRTRFQA